MTKQRWSETNGVPHSATTPSPEVQPPTERRTRSATDKLRILQEYEACTVGAPERGALLRREGIYTSQISKWRKLRDQGRLGNLNSPRRGPKAAPPNVLVSEIATLRQENARLQARLARAETIIDVPRNLPMRGVNREPLRAMARAG
jgi:transposase-like protein